MTERIKGFELFRDGVLEKAKERDIEKEEKEQERLLRVEAEKRQRRETERIQKEQELLTAERTKALLKLTPQVAQLARDTNIPTFILIEEDLLEIFGRKPKLNLQDSRVSQSKVIEGWIIGQGTNYEHHLTQLETEDGGGYSSYETPIYHWQGFFLKKKGELALCDFEIGYEHQLHRDIHLELARNKGLKSFNLRKVEPQDIKSLTKIKILEQDLTSFIVDNHLESALKQ